MRDSFGLPRRGLAVLALTVLTLVACSPATPPRSSPTLRTTPADSEPPALGAVARLPLAFEPNTGQAPADVRYVGRGIRYRLWLTATEARFAAPSTAGHEAPTIRLRLVGGSPTPRMAAEDELPGKVNYFVGANPDGWRRHVPTYRRIVYRGAYPDIDLVFHGDQRDAEFDFVVAPGADPRAIAVELDGAHTVGLEDGDVVARAGDAALRLRRPLVYQDVDGQRRVVAGRFVLRGRQVAFEVAAYDRARPLVIDPVVSYATYLGGTGSETGRDIGVDGAGNIYTLVDGLGVVKLSADGSRLLYATVLGDAQLVALAVDGAGHAYVAGNFPKPRSGFVGVYPVTANALQPTFGQPCNQGDSDGVMAKLSADGSQLLYSSFVGGRCHYTVADIAVGPAGAIYVTGEGSTTAGYPATRTPFAPGGASSSPFPAWVQVVAGDFSRYVCSTLILADPGSPVVPSAIAVDSAGHAYVAGRSGPGFPTTPGALQPASSAGASFVAKISAGGAQMTYGTYFGNADTFVTALAVDGGGNASVAGHARAGLPTANAMQPALAGGTDAFVARLNAAGSALGFSTYLGGRADDAAVGVGLDGAGNIYVAGPTDSIDFPLRNALPAPFGAAGSNFLAALTPSGTALVYSTYVGDGQTFLAGLAVTSSGAVHLTGGTVSTSLPTVRPLQAMYGGGASDAFIARVDPGSGGGGTIRVIITAPGPGARVSGIAWLTVWVDNAAAGAKTYTLSEGGAAVDSRTTTSNGPVSLRWSTTGGANGTRSVTVSVRDAAGHTGATTRAVDVQNSGGGGGGAGPIRVFITSPAAGATVSGTAWLIVWIENAAAGSKTYTVREGGTSVGGATTTSNGPVSVAWPTTGGAGGTRSVTVTVSDPAGATGSATRAFNVQNGGAGGGGPLRVAITQPGAGKTVRGTVWFTVWVEGAGAGSNTYTLSQGATTVTSATTRSTGPVSLAWPTSAADNGSRTATVSVRDATGRIGAAWVTMVVDN